MSRRRPPQGDSLWSDLPEPVPEPAPAGREPSGSPSPPDWALPSWDALPQGDAERAEGEIVARAAPAEQDPAAEQEPAAALGIMQVSEVTRAVRDAVKTRPDLRDVWVEGEVGRVTVSAAGHGYFTLKDERSQLACVFFRDERARSPFEPTTGLRVVAHGRVDVFESQGVYQLYVTAVQPAGFGDLALRFEALKSRLTAEGLFDSARKRPLPDRPAVIGVATSATGAVWHDICQVVGRRWPLTRLILSPCQVQGEGSAQSVVAALDRLARWGERCAAEGRAEEAPEVVILARGGGSLEDLWSFNEESVARAIFDCHIPIVSGVGHEVDITIADFVADVRAATPTAAAETVTPDQSSWLQSFDWYQQRLQQLASSKIERQQEKTQWLHRRLQQQHPETQLLRAQQRSDDLIKRLLRISRSMLDYRQNNLSALNAKLGAHNPAQLLKQNRQTTAYLATRLQQSALNLLSQNKSRLSNVARTLNAISPLQTLERGYSITLNGDGEAVTSAEQVKVHDQIETRLHNGRIISRVESAVKSS